MKKTLCLISALLFLVTSCREVYRYTNNTFFAMNTVVNTVVSEKIGDEGTEELLHGIESRMSRTLAYSDISRLNSGENDTPSADTYEVMERALQIAKDTDYAFNPCMGTLTDLWDITSGKNIVPSDKEIKEALSFCDASLVVMSDGKVTLPDGMKIDLGGVAKGYALQKASEGLSEKAADKAVSNDHCINLGGNVSVMGASKSRKESGNDGWTVGITNPFDKNEILGEIVLYDEIISFSGAYERYFEKDGVIYHHIFDSKTGYPAESNLAQAAVISKDGLCADALSTALFVMGKDKAIEFYKEGKYDFEMILVTVQGEVFASKNLSVRLNLNEHAVEINKEKMTIIK